MKLVIFMLSAALMSVACNTTSESNQSNADSTTRKITDNYTDTSAISGDWKLYLDSQRTANIPEVSFNIAEKRFAGTTGCNRMAGTFTINANKLTINKDMITTKMACTNYDEAKFIQAFTAVNNYMIRGNELYLMNNDAVAVRLIRK